LLLVFSATLSDALWPPGNEIVYDYHAQLQSTTKFPSASTSQWDLYGKLVVQGEKTRLQYSCKKLKYQHIPVHQLLQPFILHFEEGKLVALSVKAGEDEWAINMKRGIAGLLQLDPEALLYPTTTLKENSLHGNCKVEYSSHNMTNNTLSVSKNIDLDSCPGSGKITHEVLCPNGPPQNTIDVLSRRWYLLDPLGPNGEYVISSAASEGAVVFQPFNFQSEVYYIWTWIHVKLTKIGTTENLLSVKNGGERVSLNFVLPVGDVSQGRNLPDQQDLISAVISKLHELGESLDPPGLEKNLTNLHEERVAHILYFLSLLNHTSLNQLYSDLAVGTSYQHETFRNLFLELLPIVGSYDAALLIRDLIMSGTLKNDTAVDLLTTLPFSLHHPSEKLLTDFEVILTLPEHSLLYSTAILTFATLVERVCHKGCSYEVRDKYVGQYMDLFTSSDTFDKQLLYLEALSNFQLKRVAQYFEPIIQGTDTKYSHYIRFLSIWLTEGNGYLTSEKAFELFWPILTNRDELLEMRVGALSLLTRTKPSTSRFYQMLSYMVRETDPHLRHAWYTTLHSIANTKHPLYSQLVDLAKKTLPFYPEPEVHQWSTGHYIFDYTNPDYGFGSIGQLYTIANPHTGVSSIITLNFATNARACSTVDYLLYLRLEGFGDILKRVISKKRLNVDTLLELFKQLKVPSKASQPLHVEIILKLQDKVILVHHANETTFNSLYQVLHNVQHLAAGGVHINAQNIIVPFLLEEIGPTVVGTTALIRTTHSWMMSVRANLTAGKTILNQFDFRSYLSSQTGLNLYNPVLNIWHGVKRSLNLQIIVPFDLQFSLQSMNYQNMKFSVEHKPGEEAGIVGHVETAVMVRGIRAADELESHCPTCEPYYVVKGKTDHSSTQELAEVEIFGSELKLSLLDCEHSYHMEDLLSLTKHLSEHQNSDMFLPFGPLLTLAHLFDSAILVPPYGSCGVSLKLSPLVTETNKVDVEITMNKTQKTQTLGAPDDYVVHVAVTSNSSSRWDADIHYVPTKHKLTTNLSSEDNYVGSLNIHAQFPELVEEVTFLSDKEPHVASIEISAEWQSSRLQIQMDGEVTPEQKEHITDSSVWPYATCQEDLHDIDQWGDLYAPLTPACYEVAKELATLRKYKFNITSTNLPSWMNFLPEYVLNVDAPLNSRATITLNGHKKTLSLKESNKLESLLINTHFPPLVQLATRVGSLGSCVVTSKRVWTIDGINLDSHLGSCYSLAVADCSETPQFALFLKKTDNKWFPLGLKLYVGDSHVEILPHEHNINITVNDLEVPYPEKGYEHPLQEVHYDFRLWKRADGLVRIYLNSIKSWIEYYGHFATVSVSGLYRGKLCGLCGNFNRDTKDDTAHLYTIPCAA
ncbi:hypothetical protein L9F63_009998, partial [Diploptera punctata]